MAEVAEVCTDAAEPVVAEGGHTAAAHIAAAAEAEHTAAARIAAAAERREARQMPAATRAAATGPARVAAALAAMPAAVARAPDMAGKASAAAIDPAVVTRPVVRQPRRQLLLSLFPRSAGTLFVKAARPARMSDKSS